MPRVSSGVMQDNPYLQKLIEAVLSKNEWYMPRTTNEVLELVDDINNKLTGGHSISESTLLRLIGSEKYSKSFDINSTLNPLSKLAGYRDWNAFQDASRKYEDDCPVIDTDYISNAEDLDVGFTFIIGWHPKQYVKLRYEGDCEFLIMKYVGTGINRAGQKVAGRWFEKVDVPPSPGVLEVTQDIAGVFGYKEYDRLYL